MSRVGRKEIPIPKGVAVDVVDRTVKVKGPKGELIHSLLPGLGVEHGEGTVAITQQNAERSGRAVWGLTRALIANMVVGVSQGYTRALELRGTGYRAQVQGRTLVLSLGYSHEIRYELPNGVSAAVEGPKIRFESIDKQLIGQVAAEVRAFRPPEPYNGKGVRYEGEQVKQKAGKTAAAS
jgi:large subunit ribosomal protein L6